MLRAFKARLRNQGVLRTVYYAVTVFILPKLGIDVKHEFLRDSRDTEVELVPGSECLVEIVTEISSFSPDDLRAMREFEGEGLIQRLGADFRRGHSCAIARDTEGHLVGIGWLEHLGRYDSAGEHLLIRDCFVLPQHRGHGYFPALLRLLCLRSVDQRAQPILFQGNVNMGNTSSSHAFLKAGFGYDRTEIRLFGRHLLYFRSGVYPRRRVALQSPPTRGATT